MTQNLVYSARFFCVLEVWSVLSGFLAALLLYSWVEKEIHLFAFPY